MTVARAGSSPTAIVPWPIASSSGRQRSIAAAGPATTIQSFFASAASGRPKTGAARYACPAARCRSASRRDRAGLIVLIETWIAPRPIASTTPPPSSVASSTASSATMVMSTSAPRAAAAADPATVAPRRSSASARLRVRL